MNLQHNLKIGLDKTDLSLGEKVEDLQCKGLKIIQNKKLYCFTSDSVILANFVKTKASDTAVEIGAGSGVISILVQAKNKLKKLYAFELQQPMAQLCEKNISLNNLGEKIEIIQDDVKNHKKYIKNGQIDVIFSNPPYFKETNFTQSEVKKIAKEEVCLSCDDLCKVASEMLKSSGAFYVCYAAERAAELIFNLQKHNLATKEMFFTENGKGEVKVVFIKAVKNGKFGCKVRSNLVTNEENGTYLETLQTKNFVTF